MTGRRKPPRRYYPGGPPKGAPKQPPKPKGFDDVPELSTEEVERRVDVRGGGAPRAPVERPVRTARPPRKKERTLARDLLLLIGLVSVGLVAVRFILPEGPLTATATATPGNTEVAAGTTQAPSVGPSRTPFTETLTPVITPSSGPEITAAPTPQPVPTPTLKPGQTPHPTPKVTPKPTPTPTPGPTAPNRATVIVKLVVITDSGGSASGPADWTMHVGGSAGGSANPNNFAGSTSGTSVSIPAGTAYSVSSGSGPTDYAAFPGASAGCSRGSGGLAGGSSVTCTITRDDRPRVHVTVNVNGGGPSTENDVTVTVTGGEAKPPSFTGSGTTVVGFGLSYSIDASSLTDYTSSGPVGGGCDGSLALDAAPVSCTFTYDYAPPPAPAAPFLILPFLRPRRWQSIPTS